MGVNTNKISKGFFDVFNQFSRLQLNHSLVASLTTSEVFILFCINRLNVSGGTGSKVSEISQALGVSSPMVTQLINTLEDEEFIERTTNREDRRVVCIKLTDKGRKEIKSALESLYGMFS